MISCSIGIETDIDIDFLLCTKQYTKNGWGNVFPSLRFFGINRKVNAGGERVNFKTQVWLSLKSHLQIYIYSDLDTRCTTFGQL